MAYESRTAVAALVATGGILAGCTPAAEAPAPPPTAERTVVPAPSPDGSTQYLLPPKRLTAVTTPHIDTGLTWVKVQRDSGVAQCGIDMRHVLHGNAVVDVLNPGTKTLCQKGDTILPGSLPPDYNTKLDEWRQEWNKLTANTKNILQAEERTYSERVRPPHMWLAHIGALVLNNDQRTLGPRPNDEYGPGVCMFFKSDRSVVEIVGNVAFRGKSYGVGIVHTPIDTGSPCKEGDVVLLGVPRAPGTPQPTSPTSPPIVDA